MSTNVITNRSIFLIIKDAHDLTESITESTKRSSTFIRFVPSTVERELVASKMFDFRSCLGNLAWNVYFSDDLELEADFPGVLAGEIVLVPTSLLHFPRIRKLFEHVVEAIFPLFEVCSNTQHLVQELAEAIESDDFLLARTSFTIRGLLEMLLGCGYRPDILTEERLQILERTDRDLLDSLID